MLKVPFAVWIVFFLSLWIGALFYLWARDYWREKSRDNSNRTISRADVKKCPYCNAICEKKGEGPQKCSVCGSWI